MTTFCVQNSLEEGLLTSTQASTYLSFSAEPRVTGDLGLIYFTSCLSQRFMYPFLFRLARTRLCVLVTVPRVETRCAALGTLELSSEVGEAK